MDHVVTNANGFVDWLASKPPAGSTCLYHTGFLARDRGDKERTDWQREIHVLADVVYGTYQTGKVVLVQRRVGPRTFHYLAVCTAKAAGAGQC